MSKSKLGANIDKVTDETQIAPLKDDFDQHVCAEATNAARAADVRTGQKKPSKIIITDSDIDPHGAFGAIIAEKYANREARKRGRPDDPEMDIKILNTAARLSRPVSLNHDLRHELAADKERAGGRLSEETIKTRIRRLVRRATILTKRFMST